MENYVTLEEYKEMWNQGLSAPSSSEPQGPSEYDGIKLSPAIVQVVQDFKTWEVRPDDVWIVTYPKAGTSWAQEIMSCVMEDGDLDAVRKRHAAFRVPHLESSLRESVRKAKNLPATHRVAEEIPSPRLLKSHLPGQLLPPQLWEKRPRIVYVLRNPKDLAVSFFHFGKMISASPEVQAQPFGEFLDEMMAGTGFLGPWWQHYLYFWERRDQDNILLLRFEDMKKDLRGHVERISTFLGKDLSPATLDAITEHCSFASMKANPMANPDTILANREVPDGATFMRKGKVGDWKTLFTPAQSEAMDKHIEEKLSGTTLSFSSN